jgi:hypothetical protein
MQILGLPEPAIVATQTREHSMHVLLLLVLTCHAATISFITWVIIFVAFH